MSTLLETVASRLLAPAVRAVTAPAAARFERALDRPRQAQERCLAAILAAVRGSRQADRIAGFDRIATVREFQDAVPLCRFDDLAGDVEAMSRGDRAVLSSESVVRFERSGGSSGPAKLVPHTRALMAEFHAALLPWLHDLARARPAAWAGPGYWSVSPLAQAARTTAGGIPIGASDDAYFPRPMRRVLARAFAVPGIVARLPDVATCRYVSLRLLLECGDLAMASAWNPSFLTLLFEALDLHGERLLDDLAAGACRPPGLIAPDTAAVLAELPLRADRARASSLRDRLQAAGSLEARDVWPSLALLSVWTDGLAARALPALCERFPGVEVQGKGLLACEGVVSIPMLDAPAPVLAVRSHLLEFIEADIAEADDAQSRPKLAHELETGRSYEVVMSTAAGFLRYRIGDRVRVVGYHHETPCVRFEGRADAVSDLVGEKLSAAHVGAALARAFAASRFDAPRFALLAPEWGAPPGYILYLETHSPDEALAEFAVRFEALLGESHGYAYARSLGQLGAVQVVRVEDGARRYEARRVALGQRAGDVKPAELDPTPGWKEWMLAKATEPAGATV